MAEETQELMSKFNEAIDALVARVEFTNILLLNNNEIVSNQAEVDSESNETEEKQLSVLEQLASFQESQLKFLKDSAKDAAREDDLAPDPNDTTEDSTVPSDGSPAPSDGKFDFAGMGIGRWLTGLALAPFAFQFAKGFVGAITDGLVELTFAGMEGISAVLRKPIQILNTKIAGAFTWLDDLAKGGSKIASIFQKFAGTVSKIGGFIGSIFSKIPGVGVFKVLLGRLAWPITLVLGAIEAVTSFMDNEGNFIDKFTAGIGGFFASVVGAPLDLLKGVVSWILNSFGLEGASEWLSSFSISDLIRGLFTRVGDSINRVFDGLINSVTDIFDGIIKVFNGDLSGLGQMFGGLIDFIYTPINAVVNWVQGMFGWGDPEEPFSLSGFIAGIWKSVKAWFAEKLGFGQGDDSETGGGFIDIAMDAWQNVKDWFASAFSFLPSMGDIKDALLELLPSWLRPESSAAERERLQSTIDEETAKMVASDNGDNVYWGSESAGRESSQEKILEAQARLAELESIEGEIAGLSRGGIVDAPDSGGLAILHGTEAVIPLDSPRAIDRMNAVSEGSSSMARAFMQNNISPTTIKRGGDVSNSNNRNTTIINKTVDPSRSLDPALP